MTDPLKTLPKTQLNAFKVIVKRIEWLLKDEIASALINISPVTEATLDNVAEHVRSSTAKNCQFHLTSLRFVCGLDKSLQLFLTELSKAKINSYRLVSRGKYFYLTGDELDKRVVNGNGDEEAEAVEEVVARRQHKQSVDHEKTKDGIGERPQPHLKPQENEKEAGEQSDAANVDSIQSDLVNGCMVVEDRDDVYSLCRQIVVEVLDTTLSNQEEGSYDDRVRSRSGSLPLLGKENGEIVRRRFSDTGISYCKSGDLSLTLEDLPLDLQGFETHDTPRKTGPEFWLFASVQGSEVTVYYHKK